MKKIQDLFIKLVKIDSPPGHEEKLADFVIDRLKKLNLIVRKDKFGNILARSRKFNKEDSILISAHLDIVKSNKGIVPKTKNGVIYSDGKNILGADNKAAIAEIIYALEKIKNKSYSNFELLFTVQEENGLVGAKRLDKKLIKSKKALVLDYSFPVGFIALKTASAVIIKIKIFGKASHGARVDLGENTINLASECISKFRPKSQKGLNYNVGLIKGGTAVNVVPDFVEISLAVRADSEVKLNRFVKRIENHFKKIVSKKGDLVSIEKTRVGFGYSYGKTDKFIKEMVEKFRETKVKVNFAETLGLSDANVLNRFGIKTIEIGYGPKNVHTNKESITIDQMKKMSEFLINLLKVENLL